MSAQESVAEDATVHKRHTLTDDERAELDWLRAENTLLRTEKAMLLRVATGFAEDAHAL